MGRSNAFARRPDLTPKFLPDAIGRRPFGGFQFLEGVVVLGANSVLLDDAQLRCLPRAMLGQPSRVIADKLSLSVSWVEDRMAGVYSVLGITKGEGQNHGITIRAILFPVCLDHEVMLIQKPGRPDLISPVRDNLEMVRYMAEGLTNAEISDNLRIDPAECAKDIRKLYNRVGIRGREVVVVGAMITEMVSLGELYAK